MTAMRQLAFEQRIIVFWVILAWALNVPAFGQAVEQVRGTTYNGKIPCRAGETDLFSCETSGLFTLAICLDHRGPKIEITTSNSGQITSELQASSIREKQPYENPRLDTSPDTAFAGAILSLKTPPATFTFFVDLVAVDGITPSIEIRYENGHIDHKVCKGHVAHHAKSVHINGKVKIVNLFNLKSLGLAGDLTQ